MKLNLKKDTDCKRTLSVSVPWEDAKDGYQKEFNKILSNYTPPGGRKGKVFGRNLEMFKKNYTPAIEAQFSESAVNGYYRKALEELKINPVNQGNIIDLNFNEGQELNFKIAFEVKPDFKLPNYKKKVKIETNKYIANDIDLNNSLENLQNQHAKAKTVDGKIKEGHFLYADFSKLGEDGQIIENSTLKNHYIRIGEGLFVEKLADSFIGKKAGNSIDAEIDQDSGPVKYRITVNRVEEQVLPKLNNDFAKMVDPEVKDLKELKLKVKSNLQKNLDQENLKEYNGKVKEYFLDKSKFDLPESMLDNYIKYLNEQYEKQYASQGQKYDKDSFKDEIEKTASKTVQWHLMREQLIIDEEIKISSQEIDDYIKNLIDENPPEHKDEIKKFYEDNNNRFNLHEQIVDKKLFEKLNEYFTNKIKEVSTDDIRKNSKGKK